MDRGFGFFSPFLEYLVLSRVNGSNFREYVTPKKMNEHGVGNNRDMESYNLNQGLRSF